MKGMTILKRRNDKLVELIDELKVKNENEIKCKNENEIDVKTMDSFFSSCHHYHHHCASVCKKADAWPTMTNKTDPLPPVLICPIPS